MVANPSSATLFGDNGAGPRQLLPPKPRPGSSSLPRVRCPWRCSCSRLQSVCTTRWSPGAACAPHLLGRTHGQVYIVLKTAHEKNKSQIVVHSSNSGITGISYSSYLPPISHQILPLPLRNLGFPGCVYLRGQMFLRERPTKNLKTATQPCLDAAWWCRSPCVARSPRTCRPHQLQTHSLGWFIGTCLAVPKSL